MNLKKQIEYLLEKNNMNATQLARKANMPRQNITNWLSGQKPKNVEQVMRVAQLFGVSLDHLLFGNSEEIAKKEQDIFNRHFEVKIVREILD